MSHKVVYEATETGYSAYVPDVPGCVAAAETRAETERLMSEALESHVEMLRSLAELEPPRVER